MNTVQLECFITVAEHLNFSKASRVLKITQPAVSHQIQTLEEELGVKLFDRTSKSVTLTQEGISFFADAQLILKTALSAKERLGRHERFIPFELGCHNYTEMHLLPPILKELSKEFPLLRPSIRLIPFPSILGMVENTQLMAALGIKYGQNASSLWYRELASAHMACVCSPKHPLAQYKTLSKEQLTGNFIACSPRQLPDSVFTIQNNVFITLPSEQRFVTENIESAFTLVKAEIGYTLYPDIPNTRDPGLCYIPINGFPKVSFGIYYQYAHDHPVLKRFLALITQYMKEKI